MDRRKDKKKNESHSRDRLKWDEWIAGKMSRKDESCLP